MLPPLILASTSPRRRELLGSLGVAFTVIPSPYTETNDPSQSPERLVRDQSLGKALAVSQQYPDHLILGSDTLVAHQGMILGKPKDPEEAVAMLTQIQGQWHEVYTGVALIGAGSQELYHQISAVKLRTLTAAEISWYVGTKEPLDKAGAYALQGIGAALVEEVRGCYSTVIGLPLPWVFSQLWQRGYLS